MGKEPHGGLAYGAFLALEKLAAGRSWEARGTLGETLGGVWHAVDAGRRRIARDNVARAFPDWSPVQVRQLVRRNFAHLGAVGAEFLGLAAVSPGELLERCRFEGFEHVTEARARGKGVLALTGHQGNWELSGVSVSAYAPPVSFVGRRLKNPGVNRRVKELRERFGGHVIGHRDAVRPILRALREGRIIGMLMDHKPMRREAVLSRFFGQPVATNQGLAVLALKSGTPVVPGFGRRVPGGHVVRFAPPVPPPEEGDLPERILRFTETFDAVIEAAVREQPEQWFWVHKRWRIPEGLGA